MVGITETSGIILVCFDGKYSLLEPIKNTKKFKSLLTSLLHRGPLKTTSGAAVWAALVYIVTTQKPANQKFHASIDCIDLRFTGEPCD